MGRDPPYVMEIAAKAAIDACSVIVPVHNEAGGVVAVLRALADVAQVREILVVDDGSTDGTREAVIAAAVPKVRVLSHEENLGYGASLKTGIREATTDWILIIDGDGTYPVERVADLLREGPQADMVVGARNKTHIPLLRRPAKWVLSRLANYLAQRRIPDLNSGLRLMRRSALEPFIGLLPQGFSFTTTITLAMHVNGYRVHYLPIAYHPRMGRSKIRPFRDTLNFLQLILRTIVYFEPLRVFVPASLLLFSGSLIVLIAGIVRHEIDDGTVLALFITGLQMLATGLLADLINRRTANMNQNSEGSQK